MVLSNTIHHASLFLRRGGGLAKIHVREDQCNLWIPPFFNALINSSLKAYEIHSCYSYRKTLWREKTVRLWLENI